MCIKNRIFSLFFKVIILLLALLGVFTSIMMNGSLFRPEIFLYYNVLSSGLCVFYYFIAVFKVLGDIQRKGFAGSTVAGPHFRGGLTMVMLLQLLSVTYTLVGTPFESAPVFPVAISFYILPILVVVDYALFDQKGRYRAFDPFWWLVFPIFYYLIVLVFALYGSIFQGGASWPYEILSAELLGWPRALTNVGILLLIYLIFGYIYLVIDKLLGRFAKKDIMQHQQPVLKTARGQYPVYPHPEQTHPYQTQQQPVAATDAVVPPSAAIPAVQAVAAAPAENARVYRAGQGFVAGTPPLTPDEAFAISSRAGTNSAFAPAPPTPVASQAPSPALQEAQAPQVPQPAPLPPPKQVIDLRTPPPAES